MESFGTRIEREGSFLPASSYGTSNAAARSASAIADLAGKDVHVWTVPIPARFKAALGH